MGRRILVSGATGFIGLHTARLLADTGRRPRLMFRRLHRAALLAPLDADLVAGDLRAPGSLRRAVDGVDTVVHLAARATFERGDRLRPSIVDGTMALARAAADAGASTFVYASSMFVFGDHDETITPATRPDPAIDYGRLKLEVEERLVALGAEAGMRVVALRLPHVYGPESLLLSHVRRGRVPFVGELDREFSHLHVDDAARALVAAADGSWAGVAPLADRQPVTWRTLLAVVTTYLPGTRVITMPGRPARAALRAAAPLLRLRDAPSLATPDTITGWMLRQRVDATPTWDLLGLAPRYPSVFEGLPATFDAAIPFRWRHPLLDRTARHEGATATVGSVAPLTEPAG